MSTKNMASVDIHCHVVWSWIDTKSLKAIPISHDWPKLMGVSR